MNLENYLLELINGQKNSIFDKLILAILRMLELIYWFVLKIRKQLYRWGIKKEEKLDARVISIGNITVGGTGKTPVVKLLAERLSKDGYRVVILNRGYKAATKQEIAVVSNGEEILLNADKAGDEAYMLAKMLPDIPVIIGKERFKTGNYACQHFNPDFIIMDDAFQHWQVDRDYDVVVLDATNPFGKEHLLPRGLLREPLSELERADFFIMTKTDQVAEEELVEINKILKKFNSEAIILRTRHKPTYLRNLITSKKEKVSLVGQRILAVSGIGNPLYFERSLEKLGGIVVDRIRFADHHSYSKEDLLEIIDVAKNNNIAKIITTEKDAVSIDDKIVAEVGFEDLSFVILGIEIDIIESKGLFDELISRLEVKI